MKKQTRLNAKGTTVLVVEDNTDQWLLIHRAMQQVLPKIKIIRATSQGEVQALLMEWVWDESVMLRLILVDLYLPQRQQGLHVLADIQGLNPPFNQVPVVMLSHSADEADIRECYQRGCAAYVVKPIAFSAWLELFNQLRTYWGETVFLPPGQVTL